MELSPALVGRLKDASPAPAALQALLSIMSSVYIPSMQADMTWPDTTKREFTGQLHKFMASLTETSYQLQGSTVLYIPAEPFSSPTAIRDKQLLQRLDAMVVHWTRQIKDVLNQADEGGSAEEAGPLAEISFWRERSADLSSLRTQLDSLSMRQAVSLLQRAGSSYLPPFLSLRDTIMHEAAVAEDNLAALGCLEEPCTALHTALPQDVAGLLPGILQRVRLVWSLSRFYNTPERILSLLRKIGQEVTARCAAQISIPSLFSGDAAPVQAVLLQSIQAGRAWKEKYTQAAAALMAHGQPWTFDQAAVFAHVDAFIQRCGDLQDICEAQLQFAPKAAAPTFGGAKGVDTSKSITDMQSSFQQLLQALRAAESDQDILDVKAPRWFEDFAKFKTGVRDLEVMFCTVIQQAFDSTISLPAQLTLLEVFHGISKRPSIQRCLERQTSRFFQQFMAELNAIKKQFEMARRQPPSQPSVPKHAGHAMAAQQLLRRIQSTWEGIEAVQHILAEVPEAREAASARDLMHTTLNTFISSMHQDWYNSISTNLLATLNQNLLAQETNGLLTMKFSRKLLETMQEVKYWERMRMNIPYTAIEINLQAERLRVLRSNILQVTRMYNKIIAALDKEERRLFRDKIRQLDRRILPGANKLTWASSKHSLDHYYKECGWWCKDTDSVVLNFKAGNRQIEAICAAITETSLLLIEKKRQYDHKEFMLCQADHQAAVQQQLLKQHQELTGILASLYKYFEANSEEVQLEWVRFTKKMDKKLEDALRTAVRRSLQEMSRALNGDKRLEVAPLFIVSLHLDETKRIELRPTVQDLFDAVHAVSQQLIAVVKCMPRLAEAGTRAQLAGVQASQQPEGQQSFFELISADESSTLRVIMQITSSIQNIVDKVQTLLLYWEKKYKHMWDQDKDAYIRRYEKAQKPLSQFLSDINRYKDLVEEVLSENSQETVKFLYVDCSPLKQTLVSHCELWISKFTGLLNNLARRELTELHNYFTSGSASLRRGPATLEQLAMQLALHKQLVAERLATEARFRPLREQYQVLEKFEVGITELETSNLQGLDAAWVSFCQMLDSSGSSLERSKESFRERLLRSIEASAKEITEARDRFLNHAPFSHVGCTTASAQKYIAETKEALDFQDSKVAELAAGTAIFSLATPNFPDLTQARKELTLLEKVWVLVHDWDSVYSKWSGTQFMKISIDEMTATAQGYAASCQKLTKEARSWPVLLHLRDTTEAFMRTLPLISNLQSPAMRSRHWEELSALVGSPLDPHSPTFTLDSMISFHMEQHAELIGSMSADAGRQVAIEQTLQGIMDTWRGITLDMVEYKSIFKMRNTEEVYAALEDHAVSLSAMKASRFFPVFEVTIVEWEKKLSQVSEVIELVLQVQKNWLYLENIFLGSEDIRKQLPTETAMFDSVNVAFGQRMTALQQVGLALQACLADGVMEAFTEMEGQLERIQKSLEDYLEVKRQAFPRFYFLSSGDLLDILGQARDPNNVQSHLKKCFEGIKRLEMHAPGSEGRKTHQITGAFAPDGEYLPFLAALIPTGGPEVWLNEVETAMFAAVKRHLFKVLEDSKTVKKERWVRDNPGQMVITAGQIVWTAECEAAVADAGSARKKLSTLKKKWISYLDKMTVVTQSQLTAIERNKVVALITIEVHARDVIDKLGKAGVTSSAAFEWSSQLRFYWDQDSNDCIVKQVLSTFRYGYEYQGNNGRLVMTPLTDRCYMTLGAALLTRRGGNPLGPAGTGKTETVKDFGKALAKYVIVFNCSDGMDVQMTGKLLAGLAQTGAWACLDEFNRIEVEVLSVVAAQIATIMTAVKEGRQRFVFMGQDIRLVASCGIFVTMNPGYAGRSELPDNLKALLRPVSMMVPDFAMIAEISMFSEGFASAKVLATKMVAIMELSQQQLSKQDHYNYGLRSFIIPIARAAGQLRRLEPNMPEDIIMLRTMQALIQPKLVHRDLPLFAALLSDLFPGLEAPGPPADALRQAVEAELRSSNLQVIPELVTKIIEIHDCKVARHGNMLVGKTGSGKTTAWKILQQALGRLHQEQPANPAFQPVKVFPINPLAVSNAELYGSHDEATHEWQDGILARIMRTVCSEDGLDQKWILFDGPVDTLWIESMNTLLDDNRLLTLLSGERISMPPQVSLLFEVEDLSVASPATVSRAGMIYLSTEALGWEPFITSWLSSKSSCGSLPLILRRLVDKFIPAALAQKQASAAELVCADVLSCVRATTRLFDANATPDNGVPAMMAEDMPQVVATVELWFQFAVIWGIGGPLSAAGQSGFDQLMRSLDDRFPESDTVFDYFVDPAQPGWRSWESKLPASFRPPAEAPLHSVLVPTVDTVRLKFLLSALMGTGSHVLLVGDIGAGKTMVIASILEGLASNFAGLTINLSARTSSNALQDTIEGRLEKRTKGVLAPIGGKRLVAFIDDFNMPQRTTFGFIPALELLKHWAHYGFWYDRQKCEPKEVQDMQLLAAMAPPSGGRNPFSQRIQACFTLINAAAPSSAQLKRIFTTLLTLKLAEFEDVVRPLASIITAGSVDIYLAIQQQLLPVPSKPHYLFNTRDLASIVQGVMQASKLVFHDKEQMLQLWCHEVSRVLGDRMWDAADRTWLKQQLDASLREHASSSWEGLFGNAEKECPSFATFLSQADPQLYEPLADSMTLKELLAEKQQEYAMQPGKTAMDLVLFRDALQHVCRIHRVLIQPRGNALLVGVGGSGRKNLTRLAAFATGLSCFAIEISKKYRITDFREDLKKLYRQAGCENKGTVFLFDETQIVTEEFLEDINNILTSGEVPNLFPRDELPGLLEEVRAASKQAGAGETPDQLYTFFLSRVKANLHVIICMSPAGSAFSRRCRMFPGLVNCAYIDWFLEWPADALREVAGRQLEGEDVGDPAIKQAICEVFVTAHQGAADASLKMLQQLKRHNYVTPTNYLQAVGSYRLLLAEKRMQLGTQAGKLRGGLTKLAETGEQVGEMAGTCQRKAVVVAETKTGCEALLVQIVADKRVADEQEKQVNAEAQRISREADQANAIAAECQAGLDKALPALAAAEEALNVLTKKDMSELKAYAKPPALVELTLCGVMTVLKVPATWEDSKKQLGDASFMERLLKFDKDTLDDPLLRKIAKYTQNPDFTAEAVGKVSSAARGLCLWVRAMESYGTTAKDIAPKRARLQTAQDQLAKKQAALAKAQAKLQEVLAQVASLREKYEESTLRKRALEDELQDLEAKLNRAQKLLSGLAGERVRWEGSIVTMAASIDALPGDVALAAAFLSYAGPFPGNFRTQMVVDQWQKQVQQLQIPASKTLDLAGFLADPAAVRQWNLQGLPAGTFSLQNGILITRSQRWPLIIDPQGQAGRWLRALEGQRGLVILDPQMPDLVRQLESAIQYGRPVIIQDLGEEIDPVLEPVLAKAFIRKGSALFIKLGDKEIDFNPDFKLYLLTKLGNPHYLPEVTAKALVVDFGVRQPGLEAQLLDTIVRHERPDLDQQKGELVVKVAQGKQTQADLEDQILKMLSSATGSLLDNIELINALDASKATFETVTQSLMVAEENTRKIEIASEAYRPGSIRSATLYFVLNDLAAVDPMYQFSLDAYVEVFQTSLARSSRNERVDERLRNIMDFHTYSTFRYTSRGLFERHKLLLSLQMAARIAGSQGSLAHDQWKILLEGTRGMVETSTLQPCPAWLPEPAWQDLTNLSSMPAFEGLAGSVASEGADWEVWWQSMEPERTALPGVWQQKCSLLQRLLLVRFLRPDRTSFAATQYVESELGSRYVEPPMLDLTEALADSTCSAPLIFVLSPGIDPTEPLQKLAASVHMSERFFSVALGQGQAPVATRLIEAGMKEGHWVFLANCHLMTSWLPKLAKLVESLAARQPHPDFRLWLSSNATPNFPVSILQRGLKMTTEPPQGLKANLNRLFGSLSEENILECKAASKYPKLLYALAFYHSVLLERRKFRTLGFNNFYDFNDTDFKVSDDLLKTYLDSYQQTPWAALRYLVAEANYGGRVTDELDRRVLNSYLNNFYTEEALSVANFPLSPLPEYHIPQTNTLQGFKDYTKSLPQMDRPEAFGQHFNAGIAYQQQESRGLLDSLAAMQSQSAADPAADDRQQVMTTMARLAAQVPAQFDLEKLRKRKAGAEAPSLQVVLQQEAERYNALLIAIGTSCSQLLSALKGIIVFSADLELVAGAFAANKVPAAWQKVYPSLKPLDAWMRELVARVQQLALWAANGPPPVFWLGGFTYPTGFLTAILQVTSREKGIPIDTLGFEVHVLGPKAKELSPPTEGVYVKGIHLEGAGWDPSPGCLCEPQPMQLTIAMPIMHFRPVDIKKRSFKGTYACPLYMYPVRAGGPERPSFMLSVDLPSGSQSADYWTLHGTALLLALGA